jgi:dipeptidase
LCPYLTAEVTMFLLTTAHLITCLSGPGSGRPCSLTIRAVGLGVFLLLLVVPAAPCNTIIVGRAVSTDGAILLGHNEQNAGFQYPSLRAIPPLRHDSGTEVRLQAGGRLPEVAQTHGFIWSELPGKQFSDVYMNQWGVTVFSDGCPTRETRRDLTDGGIGYMLRRLVIQRARTARQGVHLAGQLVEQFGYSASGRTLVIAGPQEAWLLSLVQGRHWVARRVPDDGVVVLPNVHIITEVDLADTLNYLGSPNVIDYAIERGWYDPASGRPFSFRAAYNSSDGIDPRQRVGQQLVLDIANPPLVDGQLPFAVFPNRRFAVNDVITFLRSHEVSPSLCSPITQEGSVFQLRADLPPALGCVYWRAVAEPCAGLLVPWYAGITQTPADFYHHVPLPMVLTAAHHFSTSASSSGSAWSTFKRLQYAVNRELRIGRDSVQAMQVTFESALLQAQSGIEADALGRHAVDPLDAGEFLTRYSAEVAARALSLAEQMRDAILYGDLIPTAIAESPGVSGAALTAPATFLLGDAYPNPFNHQVRIPYLLSTAGPVELAVYDLVGQRLRGLISGPRDAGFHVVTWDGRDRHDTRVATGAYILRLRTSAGQQSRRVLLLR